MTIDVPESTHHLFAETANRSDLDAIVEMYEPEAVIIERSGEATKGIAAIRHHVATLLALHPSMVIEESRAFQNGDIALLCSRWSARLTPPGGEEVVMEYRGSEIIRRGPDGTWRFVLDNPWGLEVGSGTD